MNAASAEVVLQVVPVIVAFLALVLGIYRHQLAKGKQIQGIRWLQALRLLITHIQRHRGVSSAVLSGERHFENSLDESQHRVSRDFKDITEIGEWIKNQPEWESVTQHWARLAGNIHKLGLAAVIEQHNCLIRNVLGLVDQIAETHYLNLGPNRPGGLWRDLLTLAETLGQVRAHGTAYLGARDPGQQARSRRCLQNLMRDILITLDEPSCRGCIDDVGLQHILDFMCYTDDEVLGGSTSVKTEDFFIRATSVIDTLYDRFDESLVELQKGRRSSIKNS